MYIPILEIEEQSIIIPQPTKMPLKEAAQASRFGPALTLRFGLIA
jgi:hypothetical protein